FDGNARPGRRCCRSLAGLARASGRNGRVRQSSVRTRLWLRLLRTGLGILYCSLDLRPTDGPRVFLYGAVRCGGLARPGDPQRLEREHALALYATGYGGSWVTRVYV